MMKMDSIGKLENPNHSVWQEANTANLVKLSFIEQYHALRTGRTTAVGLCEAYIEYIQRQDPLIHAFVELNTQKALQQAKQVDEQLAAGQDLGFLHGIPFAVKDLIFVDGFQTRAGSKTEKPQEAEAAIISALLGAGAICLGKVATYEYATVGPAFDLPYEIVRNPVNRLFVTGGSSSGSAAAVASRMLRFAIGTDTGGSIRSPAAYCGVVGFKPTFNSLSSQGIVPLAPTMDVPGIMSASTLEAWLVFNAMQGRDAQALMDVRYPPSDSLKGKKIGYARSFFATDPKLHPEILAAMDKAVSVLSLLGAKIEEIELPDYQPLEEAASIILHAEAYQYHQEKLAMSPEVYGNLARHSLLNGQNITLAQILSANLVRQQFTVQLANYFKCQQLDAIVTINTLTPAAEISACNNDAPNWSPMRTIAFNLSGNPVLALPIGQTQEGLPIGLQLIGEHFAEETLCLIGSAYERHAEGFWNNEQAYGFGVME